MYTSEPVLPALCPWLATRHNCVRDTSFCWFLDVDGVTPATLLVCIAVEPPPWHPIWHNRHSYLVYCLLQWCGVNALLRQNSKLWICLYNVSIYLFYPFISYFFIFNCCLSTCINCICIMQSYMCSIVVSVILILQFYTYLIHNLI